MKLKTLACAAASLTALAACGRNDTPSSVEYSPLEASYAGLMAKVRKPTITICLSGMSPDEQWAQWSRNSVLKWIAPLRPLSKVVLASDVAFVPYDDPRCASADAQINLYSQNFRAYTRVGPRPDVNVSRADARNGHVVFHELGHAFGMGDTYYGPDTQSQPDSVMKSATFSELQPDDVAGIRYLYGRMYGVSTRQPQHRIPRYLMTSFDAISQLRANVERGSRPAALAGKPQSESVSPQATAFLQGCMQPQR